MRKSVQTLFVTAILLAAAVPLLAGGLFVMLGNPDASPEARAHNAVLTLKLAGCHEPEKATITATAIRLADGKRQTIPLKLIALSEAGSYAVTRQWPEKERWVLQFVATDQSRITSTLVAAGPDGIDRHNAKMAMQPPAEADLIALLTGGPEMARK
jgi:hypothetical protein